LEKENPGSFPHGHAKKGNGVNQVFFVIDSVFQKSGGKEGVAEKKRTKRTMNTVVDDRDSGGLKMEKKNRKKDR